jgi:hypothetical protein
MRIRLMPSCGDSRFLVALIGAFRECAHDFELLWNSSKLEQNNRRIQQQMVCAGRKCERRTKEQYSGEFNEDFEPGIER